MSTLSLRPAVLAERGELEALQWRASLMWDEYRAALLANPDAIELPDEHMSDGRTIVAERQRRIVGFAVVLPREDGEAELDGLFVEPADWHCGIGRQLVEAACARAAENGAGFLYVVGNPRAKGFYVACGFETVDETQTRFGTGLVMRRPSTSRR